ncbi:hypothetical protein [Georgenia sp. SUBG003]|uniref:hypothetical protein n=1 Tax=Georgenia sp. SUBG003 TaxID=1497974 RepID=UPI003AB4E2B9
MNASDTAQSTSVSGRPAEDLLPAATAMGTVTLLGDLDLMTRYYRDFVMLAVVRAEGDEVATCRRRRGAAAGWPVRRRREDAATTVRLRRLWAVKVSPSCHKAVRPRSRAAGLAGPGGPSGGGARRTGRTA